MGQYRQARDAATATLVLASERAHAYWYRGMAQEALGQQPQAIADWQQATRLGDTEAQATLQARSLTW